MKFHKSKTTPPEEPLRAIWKEFREFKDMVEVVPTGRQPRWWIQIWRLILVRMGRSIRSTNTRMLM